MLTQLGQVLGDLIDYYILDHIPNPVLTSFQVSVGPNVWNPNSFTCYINIAKRELGLDFEIDILVNN